METNVTLGSGQATTTVPVIAPGAKPSDSEFRRLQEQLKQMAALTELVARMESAEHAPAARQALADFSTDKVLVGLCRDRSVECKLTAVSGVASFHPRGELAVASQGALQECIAREPRGGGYIVRFMESNGSRAKNVAEPSSQR